MKPPLVSVLVLTQDHARYVTHCLFSISEQRFPGTQVVILDNCSNDGTWWHIKKWREDNRPAACIIRRNDTRQGICKNVNKALTFAEGKYVCMISGDDMMLPGKLEKLVAAMESLPEEVGMIYGDTYLMDRRGRGLRETHFRRKGISNPPSGRIFADLVRTNFIQPLTVLMRRSCLEAVGPYDEELLFEDWDMWLRISLCYEIRFFSEITSVYRVHDESFWQRIEKGCYPAEYALSNVRMPLKFIGRDPGADRFLRQMAGENIGRLYRMRHPQAGRFLKDTLRRCGPSGCLPVFRALSRGIFRPAA